MWNFNGVQDSLAEATQVAEERIGNIRTVKAFSQEQREMQTYADRMQSVLDLAIKESLARGIFYGMVSFNRLKAKPIDAAHK